MGVVIADVQAIDVKEQIAAEARAGTVLLAAGKLARAIDLAPREIAVVGLAESALVTAAWEAVPEIGAPSEIVPDTAVVVPAQVAAGVPPASADRVVDLAEVVAEAVAGVAAEVAAAVGDSEVTQPC